MVCLGSQLEAEGSCEWNWWHWVESQVDPCLQSDGYSNYSLEALVTAKCACKTALQHELGLPVCSEVPLLVHRTPMSSWLCSQNSHEQLIMFAKTPMSSSWLCSQKHPWAAADYVHKNTHEQQLIMFTELPCAADDVHWKVVDYICCCQYNGKLFSGLSDFFSCWW
jgi:hypothetical protein